jgi:hypothetical protein
MADQTATAAEDTRSDVSSEEFERLLTGSETKWKANSLSQIHGVVVGKLLALVSNGTTPLVTYSGQPGTAGLEGRTTLDLHSAHIGRDVVLMFEQGDPLRPIVVGCLRQPDVSSMPHLPGHVEVDADGERLVVSAKNQMVLRCGKASITMTKSGKVLIEGAYVSSRSTGVNRVKGGSVQLN